jgi:hypothetical protein
MIVGLNFKEYISTKYPEFTIQSPVKREVERSARAGKSSTALFRILCKSYMHEESKWANLNREKAEAEHKIFFAFEGIKISNFLNISIN